MNASAHDRLRVDDFAYDLPADAIAQIPVEPRDASRLLVVDRQRSAAAAPYIHHATFADIGRWLQPGDLLVVNDSRVLRARLRGRRRGGGAAEILLLRPLADTRWEALVRPSRRLPVGGVVEVGDAPITVHEVVGEGTRAVSFEGDPFAVMEAHGEMPLPPYIRNPGSADERYQTVYAQPLGSAAAPTAGLHFTPELLAALERAGIGRATVTLHVGLDTFRPLGGTFIDEHAIHREWYAIPPATAEQLATTRANGGRIVSVGTTTTRVLETFARDRAAQGWTDIYLTPPHAFGWVDALITNFHLPQSSLLLLVTAFVQNGMANATPLEARDTLLAAYRTALAEGYRFFSFGDAMLIT